MKVTKTIKMDSISGVYVFRDDDDYIVKWSKNAPPPWDGEIWEGIVKSFQGRKGEFRIFFPTKKVGDTIDQEKSDAVSDILGYSVRVKLIKFYGGQDYTIVIGRGFRQIGSTAKRSHSKNAATEEVVRLANINDKFPKDIVKRLLEVFK